MNRVLLTGRLTRDPELRVLASGKNVTTFSVATNEYVGNGKEKAEFHSVVTWDRLADICASFQRAVVEALVNKTFAAARWYGARSVGIAGGVSANSRLRADAAAAGERAGLPVFVPAIALSTDNAAMIAAAGLRRYHAGVRADDRLNADAALPLA